MVYLVPPKDTKSNSLNDSNLTVVKSQLNSFTKATRNLAATTNAIVTRTLLLNNISSTRKLRTLNTKTRSRGSSTTQLNIALHVTLCYSNMWQ